MLRVLRGFTASQRTQTTSTPPRVASRYGPRIEVLDMSVSKTSGPHFGSPYVHIQLRS